MLLKGIVAVAGRIKSLFKNYYSSMVLLLRGNALAGFSDLRNFSDTSSYGLPLTANGTVRFSSNVKKFGNASMYFDRETNCRITTPDNVVLNLNNTNWTIEAWIYPFGNYTTHNTIISKRNSNTTSCDWQFYLNITTGALSFYNGTEYNSPVTPQAFAWSHVAAIRIGSVIKLFLNGIEVHSFTANANSGAWTTSIGGLTSDTEKFLGYIDSIRVTKGSARYSAFTFTPPEEITSLNDPNFSNVSLLLNMNTNFSDSSLTPKTITNGGSPQISTSIKKYGAGAGNFTAGYLNVATTNDLGFGTGDFTIEMWVFKSSAIADWQGIFELGTGANPYQNGLMLRLQSTNNDPLYIAGTPYAWNPTANFPLNQWNHVALVRLGNRFNLYINGNSVFSTTNTANLGSSASAFIGSTIHSGGGQVLGGYIDDVRITKGVARYSANFAVPQSRFENDSANVSLLINSSISDSAVNFLKDSSLALTEFTMVGSPQATNAQTRNGNNTLFFNGSTSLSTTNNNLILGSDDYVLEAWIYPTSNAAAFSAIFSQGNSSATGSFVFYRSGTNQRMGFVANNAIRLSTSTAVYDVPLNQWTHVALVKNQARYSIYVNGVVDQTVDGTVFSHTVGVFKIGDGFDSSLGGNFRFFTGYMDDIKVTRGTTPIINLLQLPVSQKESPASPTPKIPNKIPRNGLQIYLGEESNKNFGTEWEDLSGNTNDHTLSSAQFIRSSVVFAANTTGTGRVVPRKNFSFGPNSTTIVWAKALPDGRVGTWRTLSKTSTHHPLLIQDATNLVGYWNGAFQSYGINIGTLGLENVWTMYTVVSENSSTSRLYLNDGTINSSAITNCNPVGQQILAFGNEQGGSQPFGPIGHVMVYDRVLTQQEIKTIFDTLKSRFGTPSTNDGLVLDLDSSNPKSYSGGLVWKDLSKTIGNINVQNRSTNWNFQTDPETGLMCLYNGTNSTYYTAGINVPLKGFNKLEGAIEMWIKNTDIGGGAQGWFVNADGSTFTNTENWFWIGVWESAGTHTFYFRQGRPGSSSDQDFTISTFNQNFYIQNHWSHFCVTWDLGNNRANIYKNGTLIGSKTNYTTASPIQDVFPTEVGQLFNGHGRTTDNAQFKGYCNVYKIYNRELSQSQIQANFNSTKIKFGYQEAGLNTNGLVLNLNARIISSYPTQGTLWSDISQHSVVRNATLFNSPVFNSEAGGSLVFNGSNQRAQLPNCDYNSFTLLMWIRRGRTTTSTTVDRLFMSVNANGWGLFFSNNFLNFSKIGSSAVTSASQIANTNWNLVAVSFSGSQVKFYINGVLDNTVAYSQTMNSSNGDYTLANRGTLTEWYSGRISSVLLYNRILTDAEIQTYFNNTKSTFGIS